MNKQIIVTTSWDDGHKLDLKLARLLKKYDIRGTFYISPKNREFREEDLLSDEEIIKINRDFEIGAHTMTHPRLTKMSEKRAFNEIIESKKYLENLIGEDVRCFCYPGGDYNKKIKELVKRTGFIGARTTKRYCFKCPSDPLVFRTTIQTYNNILDILKILRFSKFNPLKFFKNLNWEHRAKRIFDNVLKNGGMYHLWGHSWEIEKNHYWHKLEDLLAYISNRKNLKYLTNSGVITNSSIKEKNNKLKIMIVTPYFYPKVGGLENYAYNIAKGLKEKYDLEIVIVTSNYREKKDSEEDLFGMKIYKLARWFKISNTPINLMWYFQIKNIIKKEKPDVINAHTPVPFISDITARVCNDIPFIVTYHTGSMMLKGKLLEDLLIKFYESSILKVTLKKAKKIICSSDFVRFDFLKDYTNKTITIAPGVDLNRFKYKISNFKNKILFVGNLKKVEKYKGLEYLLSAVNIIKKNIKDVKLTVVGEGDYTIYYKKLCKDLEIERNVEFKGVLYNKNLVKEYQKTNVFVLPSLFDSCPLVLLEAMACKKPVIGSNIGGIPYVIDNGKNGLIVSPKDSEALPKAIIKILKNPQLAKKMGENGYKKVKKIFIWEKQIKKTNDLFTEII
jgi:glycosyltransferase involved in cell wall biosynthesis/peptidoglycan/xylan/chitin deacetylase (PgdA/CDA1 family)